MSVVVDDVYEFGELAISMFWFVTFMRSVISSTYLVHVRYMMSSSVFVGANNLPNARACFLSLAL